MARLSLQDAVRQADQFRQANRLPEAIELYRQILKAQPFWAEGHAFLAELLIQSNQLDLAARALQKAIDGRASNVVFCHNNLGVIHIQFGRLHEAAAAFRKAILAQPNYAIAHRNLGDALRDLGQYEPAEQSYRQALRIEPGMVDAMIGIGLTFYHRGLYIQAISEFESALLVNPTELNAWLNIVLCHGRLGVQTSTQSVLRRALQVLPDDPELRSALLMCLNYTDETGSEILRESLEYNRIHVLPLIPMLRPHNNPLDSDRQLRIGLISADFRSHSVAFFLDPLLTTINRTQFFIACYSQVERPDAITAVFQNSANLWRNIFGQPHEQVAEQVRADGIDILIDLGGHTVDNRLPVLARKPAPVQLTWLGYPSTTGISTIDYRLTDAIADPPGADRVYTEKLIRLPDALLVYQPPKVMPQISALPLLQNGFATFGSFNDLMKISDQTIRLWAELLHKVPSAKLILKAPGLSSEEGRRKIADRFWSLNITPDRVELLSWCNELSSHLELYNRIDIALDTFPYNGTTTTCEALLMGVPVVSLAGQAAVCRMGASLLSQLKLADQWVADDRTRFIKIAADWANRPQELSELRSSLRAKLLSSPLTDAAHYARQFENAMRNCWKKYCNDHTKVSSTIR